MFGFLANVGDSRSLIVHPATVTHGQLTEEQRQWAGIRPEQIRLSVGTEDIDDLIWDLEESLKKYFLDQLKMHHLIQIFPLKHIYAKNKYRQQQRSEYHSHKAK